LTDLTFLTLACTFSILGVTEKGTWYAKWDGKKRRGKDLHQRTKRNNKIEICLGP